MALSDNIAQALAVDATGANTYATVKTPTANATNIVVTNTGTHPAIVSLDGGTTDHIAILGASSVRLNNVRITSAVAIQAKNLIGGSNYTGLYVNIW